MEIENNIFDREQNNIFYATINNEVYQVKFENLIFQFRNAFVNHLGNVNFEKREVRTIKLNIASIGEKVWHTYQDNSPFNPRMIYSSFENCVNDKNPILIQKKCDRPIIINTDYVGNIVAKVEDFLPKCAIKEDLEEQFLINGKDSFAYPINTYRWNGMKTLKVRIETPNNFMGLTFNNSNYDPCFDLATQEWLLEDGYEETHYSTIDECVSKNHIKVHKF